MATMNITISSTRPLMMQAETLANPLSAITKAHKAVAGKRKKSEDDYLWLLESEWRASMYHDAKIGQALRPIDRGEKLAIKNSSEENA